MSSLGIEEQIDKLLTSVPAVQTTANRSFHVVDRTATVAKSTRKQQKARAKRAKLLSFHSFNMQILSSLSPSSLWLFIFKKPSKYVVLLSFQECQTNGN